MYRKELHLIDYASGMMVNMKLSILKTELNAGVSMDDAGRRIYLLQDLEAQNEGVSISELAKDMKSLLGKVETDTVDGLDEAKIAKQLEAATEAKDGQKFDIASVKIVLRTVYLNIYTPTGGETTYQYAFRVDVLLDGLIPKSFQSFKVDQLTLAIWHLETKNAAIRNKLALPDLSEKVESGK